VGSSEVVDVPPAPDLAELFLRHVERHLCGRFSTIFGRLKVNSRRLRRFLTFFGRLKANFSSIATIFNDFDRFLMKELKVQLVLLLFDESDLQFSIFSSESRIIQPARHFAKTLTKIILKVF
jgi:hypothetical protein